MGWNASRTFPETKENVGDCDSKGLVFIETEILLELYLSWIKWVTHFTIGVLVHPTEIKEIFHTTLRQYWLNVLYTADNTKKDIEI